MRTNMSNKENFTKAINDKLLNLKLSKLNDYSVFLKKSYPNYSDGFRIPGQYDMGRWIQALKDIYYNQNKGLDWRMAFDNSTKEWNNLEKEDFNNWVKFYQEGAHLKYKTAQSAWYESPDEDKADYFIPNAMNTAKESINVNLHSDIGNADDADVDDISPKEKKRIAETQRKKIISRLDSIEKLIRSDEGHLLTDSEFDSLMESIYSLKKKVSLLKKKTSGDLIYKDLIIREANILANNGLYKAASFLYVAAQSPVPAPAPAATEGKTDGGGSGLPGAIPGGGGEVLEPPGVSPAANEVPQPANSEVPKAVSQDGMSMPNNQSNTAPTSEGIEGFVNEMNSGKDDALSVDDIVVYDDNDSEDLLITEAQAAEVISPKKTAPLQVFDDRLESLLAGVTIDEVVTKLEEISKIFKTREIPRQLAVVDMMLDKLGLASFFPSLSEAINKSLESNNYVLTRIDGIMSQLSGALKIKHIDLTPGDEVTTQNVSAVKENLKQKEEQEKSRKETREELSNKVLDERAKEQAPDLEVSEEELPEIPQVPTAPAAAPAQAPAPVKKPG